MISHNLARTSCRIDERDAAPDDPPQSAERTMEMELFSTAEPSSQGGCRGGRVRRALGRPAGYNPLQMLDLREHLQNLFGLDEFRPAQREVIEDVLRGREVL